MSEVPTNLEAEYAVIGTLLLGVPGDWDRARRIVGPEDFYRGSFGLIFAAMEGVARAGAVPDIITVSEHLTQSQRDEIGLSTLWGLLDSPLTGQNVEGWAKIVKDKAVRRRMIEAADLAAQAALDPTVDLGSVVKNWQQAANSLGDQGGYLEDLPAR